MIGSVAASRVVCLALTLGAAAAASADTYPRQPGVDAWHYTFRLTISDTSPEIGGEATVDLRLTRDGIETVTLDLASAAAGKGMTVLRVTSDGRSVTFAHEARSLTLTLPAPSRAGQHVRFTIAYRGVPADGLRLLKNKHGEWCAFSENWPDRAREWLPLIDQWLRRPTSPSFDGGWRYDAAAKQIEVELTQTQPGDAYRMPLEIGVTLGTAPATSTRIERVEVTTRHHLFRISSDRAPAAVTVDPEMWLLADTVTFTKRQ